MNEILLKPRTQDIVLDEVFPHRPEIVWKALTEGALMARWMMEPHGFEALVGNRFTFRTKPAGAWDGVIHCEVLDIVPGQRFAYSWQGGDEGNVGYGARLETVVTWTLSASGEGTRLRLVHAGFVLPRNDSALRTIGDGWISCMPRLGEVTRQLH